ncbi:MAG TPA: hypothetical protein ENJ00_00545 [Phycisphaerales bacterium]|nr:hypothetical protein [Phycisphaerales bacterium]
MTRPEQTKATHANESWSMDSTADQFFDGRLLAECLNKNWFLPLADAKEIVAAWKLRCNTKRPHSTLGNLTPEEFAASSGQAGPAG